MSNDKNRLEIENTPESFQNLIDLVNFYSKTLADYQKLLFVLNNLPRHNGQVLLQEDCFEIIQGYIDDYKAVHAYAQKMMGNQSTTIH